MIPIIDPQKHRVIDISHTVKPGENPDRPFAVQRGLLADRTFKYDVLLTHTHVGTHVECPAHFFDEGKSVTDLPLDRFHGRGVLLPLTEMKTGVDYCRTKLDDIILPEDIVVIRNDTKCRPTKEALYSGEPGELPALDLATADYFMEKRVKMLVLDNIKIGGDIDEGRRFHDILMGEDACFVEIVENLHSITRRAFYVMALPYKAAGMDSGWARAIVIEEK